MRRAISKEIEDPLSEELLKGTFKDTAIVRVVLQDGALVFKEKEEAVVASVN
jgi:ATP-dependent Clp protease ATP-binding subunit ClpC